MPTSETIDQWSEEESGFKYVDGRDWVDVQKSAKKYSSDSRRDTYERDEWESSAIRFICAISSSKRWTCDPTEDAVFETAVHPRVALFDQHRLQRGATT